MYILEKLIKRTSKYYLRNNWIIFFPGDRSTTLGQLFWHLQENHEVENSTWSEKHHRLFFDFQHPPPRKWCWENYSFFLLHENPPSWKIRKTNVSVYKFWRTVWFKYCWFFLFLESFFVGINFVFLITFFIRMFMKTDVPLIHDMIDCFKQKKHLWFWKLSSLDFRDHFFFMYERSNDAIEKTYNGIVRDESIVLCFIYKPTIKGNRSVFTRISWRATICSTFTYVQ